MRRINGEALLEEAKPRRLAEMEVEQNPRPKPAEKENHHKGVNREAT